MFSNLYTRSISTKLVAINVLIAIVFFFIVSMVFISFDRIEEPLKGVIDDMQHVSTNALTEREIMTIVADTNLLLTTFFENEAHLEMEGERLKTVTLSLKKQIKENNDFKQLVSLFSQRLDVLLAQCKEVNNWLYKLGSAEHDITFQINTLEEVIAETLIDQALKGEETSILEQLAVLVAGYRVNFLEICKLHAQKWPPMYYLAFQNKNDPLLSAVDELSIRFRTLKTTPPDIQKIGEKLTIGLQSYRTSITHLNAEMVTLKKQMLAVEDVKKRVSHVTTQFDQNISQATQAANTAIAANFKITKFILLVSSAILILALLFLTDNFFKKIIKKPINDIQKGIASFRKGHFEKRINLYRHDEWHLIENALNTMAADLSASYTDLQRAQSFVSNIINSMPSILVGVDMDGLVTQWNSAAIQDTGVDADSAYGKPAWDLMPNLASQKDNIITSIRTGQIIHAQERSLLFENEIRYIDITIFPLVAHEVEGAVIRMDDVTDKVQTEEMMVQNEKMLSIGGLAAGMAHEINNPLAGMLQTASVMQNRLEANLDIPANQKAAVQAGTTIGAIEHFMNARGIHRMLETITSSGLRAAGIIENMLSFAHKSDSTMSWCHMDKLVDKTLELAATDYDLKKQHDFKMIQIIKEYDTDLPTVLCEESKIQQVLLNLFRNGAQAMQSAATQDAHFIIRLYTEEQLSMVCIEIQDNGPGMDGKTRKRIFEPFFTTKPVGVGTGLGLSVSYFIVTKTHGGQMAVESQPGLGAKFIIHLPVEPVATKQT